MELRNLIRTILPDSPEGRANIIPEVSSMTMAIMVLAAIGLLIAAVHLAKQYFGRQNNRRHLGSIMMVQPINQY